MEATTVQGRYEDRLTHSRTALWAFETRCPVGLRVRAVIQWSWMMVLLLMPPRDLELVFAVRTRSAFFWAMSCLQAAR